MSHNTVSQPDAQTWNALDAVRRFLMADGSFSGRSIDSIIWCLKDQGTLVDHPCVFPGEMEDLLEVYVNAFDPVPFDSAEWDVDSDFYTPNGVLPTTTDVFTLQRFQLMEDANIDDWHNEDFPDSTPDQNWKGRGDDVTLIQPISGGCDDIPPPYEPTPADWEEYHRIMDEIEQSDNYLKMFNKLRDAASERPA